LEQSEHAVFRGVLFGAYGILHHCLKEIMWLHQYVYRGSLLKFRVWSVAVCEILLMQQMANKFLEKVEGKKLLLFLSVCPWLLAGSRILSWKSECVGLRTGYAACSQLFPLVWRFIFHVT